MRILITGICGFVGSELACTLADHGSTTHIVGIDNLSRPGSWNNRERLTERGIKVIHGDIRCSADLDSIGGCDWVIDAAANASVLAGVQGSTSSRQLVDNNLSGTINLLEFCKVHKAGFILLSTSRVYSIAALSQIPVEVRLGAFIPQSSAYGENLSEAGITETFSTAAPVSLYGATKLASEVLALEYGAAFDFPVWINRCGVMAGAGQFGRPDQGIFAFWLHSWREKRPLKYIGFDGQGHQVRDCLHPRDLVPLLMKQIAEPARSNKPRIVNVSGGLDSARSLAHLSQWCSSRWGHHPVKSDPEPRPYDLPWVVLDSSLVAHTWNWHPKTCIEIILSETADFAEAHPDWITSSL
ncbi:CDP-paratose 2-epimerase [Prosthecobacter fusiformis]|uniref:CDP-paratose 2-epimerase n=1 Tax=Prosthecobacter fusiformis TaxID=48464 RepID=A0A4R7RZL0_9BACT|nr:NAD-dependent epimerase/dehydratase family protein [Prosthecobacter fusiformis]TDU71382.1 CDP-paratose 2-epimerase [Prosthecobacter fusiformis]